MTKCFEANIEATESALGIVMDKSEIKVEKIQTQCSMKNIKGRSLELDIYTMDSTGKKYNIEIQRADKETGAKRAGYNNSLIDSDILPAGFDVENLAETFVTNPDDMNFKVLATTTRYYKEDKAGIRIE